ncbi:hmg-i/hmg-y, DNA-binding protein [Sporothrix schenckii 1099-18]|uniref:Hmg-i/hmg-y, DNA-binding protein n=1 Tax=Sporothrix schenckii 1099-18 TaxID=1397361 RepID=A0A0F2MK80_SPOSC|nr:hmg-i/hmg-y, DNA-binding protein [Sporothrix schenckii 1099-18]KJR89250.1 hmg-i/hmg-y, DNA-binding protein [Sporothrix schenckii 1099-18]
MASEPPGGGQQKKLHPLFAPSKPSRNDNKGGSTAGSQGMSLQAEPQQAFQQQTLALQPNPGQAVPLPTSQMHPPEPSFLSAAYIPVSLPPMPATVPHVTPALAPNVEAAPVPAPALAEPSAPVPMNAFQKLQQPKRKPEASLADERSESIPPAAEPKRRGRPPKNRRSSPPAQNIASLAPVVPDTSSPSPLILGLDNGDTVVGGLTDSSGLPSTAQSSTAASTPAIEASNSTAPAEQPKRLLQFNPKTGTIGSPPKPKETFVTKPGRPKKKSGGSSAIPTPLIVPYPSQDPESRARISNMIASILNDEHRLFPLRPSAAGSAKTKEGTKPAKSTAGAAAKQQPAATPATPKPVTNTSSKNTHPFFTGGVAKVSAAKDGTSYTPTTSKSSAGGSSMNYYTSTPCSPKRRGPQSSSGFRMPQFGAKNGMLRVPGACHPAWPWKGAVHVHPEGDTDPLTARTAMPGSPSTFLPHKKRKGYAVTIGKGESILEQQLQSLGVDLVIQDIRNANSDEFTPAPPELRLPQKHIESGPKLQARITPQLRTNHPGLESLFASIATTLSAFDQHHCESLSWAQKYAPSCAVEVLQSGPEPIILKNWLEALKVVSVDTGSAEPVESKAAAAAAAKGRTKRRKQKNKLDGFIVSSDDEDDNGETSDNEADWSPSGRYGLLKKTVVRAGNLLDKAGRAGARLTNAIVISGPHGSGKSAAVYAVAKELGFEVFEINASSRRNGKDVTDRIGDMTRNHLVQHKNKKLFKATASAEPIDLVDDYEPDLEDADGDPDPDFPMAEVEMAPAAPNKKQPTMSSFFKPQQPPSTTTSTTKRTDQTTAEGKPSQKQSLILLEEADLLYEEDKQFWATVMNLIVQSKRPFVITCNDETLIPLHNLRLHAILRFTPPPADAAIDRLIMIAACEGHSIQRKAVQSLYEVRNRDFRASLTDLQFWCQISVGDRRGGFDWFYQRWPEGIDRDDDQHIKRVVSENTYQEGMGWLNNDSVAGSANASTNAPASYRGQVEETLVKQAWNDWRLDVGDWQDSLALSSWAASQLSSDHRSHRQELLEAYEKFSDAMSDADLVSSMVFATGDRLPLDATQPELPHKAHEDYILGQQLLERTTPAHELDELRLPMATAVRCIAKGILRDGTATTDVDNKNNTDARGCLHNLDEPAVMSAIRKEHAEPQGRVASDMPSVRRIDFSLAFDPIAVASSASSGGFYSGFYAPTPTTSTSSSHLEPSVFDRNLEPIAVDVAPFVRGIVAYESRLQKQRQKLSSFLSEAAGPNTPAASSGTAGASTSDSDATGSEAAAAAAAAAAARRRPAKRMRTTRTAMSALEGGSRSAVRKERWFDGAEINPVLVMQTAGNEWAGVVEAVLAELGKEAAEADARDAAALAAAPPPPPLVPALDTVVEGLVSIAPFPLVDQARPEGQQSVPGSETGPARTNRRHDLIVSSPGGPENTDADS